MRNFFHWRIKLEAFFLVNNHDMMMMMTIVVGWLVGWQHLTHTHLSSINIGWIFSGYLCCCCCCCLLLLMKEWVWCECEMADWLSSNISMRSGDKYIWFILVIIIIITLSLKKKICVFGMYYSKEWHTTQITNVKL